MLVLAIDTSTPAVTVGLVELPQNAARGGPRLLEGRRTVDARAHAELLAPQIAEVLPAGAPEAIVCGAGPGPFTGLRVGMVTAAALGDALGLPVYGVCSLDAIAADVIAVDAVAVDAVGADAVAADAVAVDAVGAEAAAQALLVATDARRREVYWAFYRDGVRLDGPHVQKPAELADRLAELGVTVAAGAGAELYRDVLGLPLLGPAYPSATGLVAVAATAIRCGERPAPLVPLYLRRPDVSGPPARKSVLAAPVDKS